MKPFLALVFSLALLCCGCGTESIPTTQEPSAPVAKETSAPTAQKKRSPSELADAIAKIKMLGGRVSLNESGEVISVALGGTQITDAGLKHLKGLTSLTVLSLRQTQITDAGLEPLKGLTGLYYLDLTGTLVTSAGLEHLKGITSLTDLYLSDTKITDAGLSELKTALPRCRVSK